MKIAKKIQVLCKTEGLRIIIKPDYFMQAKWQRYFGKDFTLADTIREKIPEGLFAEEPIGLKERIFYFNCREQAMDIVVKIVLYNRVFTKDKKLKLWTTIYALSSEHKLYIKAVTEIGPQNRLKTMFLAGNETTGLINNL